MLKALIALLVLVNAALFAWTRGWLAPALPSPEAREREPERLRAQVRPDRIVLLSPQAAVKAAEAASQAAAASAAASQADAPAEVGGASAPPASPGR